MHARLVALWCQIHSRKQARLWAGMMRSFWWGSWLKWAICWGPATRGGGTGTGQKWRLLGATSAARVSTQDARSVASVWKGGVHRAEYAGSSLTQSSLEASTSDQLCKGSSGWERDGRTSITVRASTRELSRQRAGKLCYLSGKVVIGVSERPTCRSVSIL